MSNDMDCNPYSSPICVETTDTTPRRSSFLKRAIVFTYLLVFCLLHGIHFWAIVETVAEERLILTLIYSGVVPVFAAISVALYAVNFKPQRHMRFWQAVPVLVFVYLLICLRRDFDVFSDSYRSVAFVVTVVGQILIYLPAIYMSYNLGGPRPYWAVPPAEKAPDRNQGP